MFSSRRGRSTRTFCRGGGTLREFNPVYLLSYVWESRRERELVNVFATVGSFDLRPSNDEVSEGRYWKMSDIQAATGANVFTPNFEHEFGMIRDRLLSLL